MSLSIYNIFSLILLYILSFNTLGLINNTLSSTDNIWFFALDPKICLYYYPTMASCDYMNLFNSTYNSQWAISRSHIKYFKVSTEFLYPGDVPDSYLIALFDFLQQSNISLIIEGPGLTSTTITIEGFLYPGLFITLLQHVKALGGTPDIIMIDEPLYHAHYLPNVNWTIPQTISNLVSNLYSYREVFPNLKFASQEPNLGLPDDLTWLNTIGDWLDSYYNAMGEHFIMFHVDVNWQSDYVGYLKNLSSILNLRNIPLGVIFNSNVLTNAVDWTLEAEKHMSIIENPANNLDIQAAVIQTWTALPSQVLPETSPGTMTYLVTRYLAKQPVINLEYTKTNMLVGTFTDTNNNPVSNVPVSLSVTYDNSSILTDRTITGIVPAGAAWATFAINININCGCNGQADIKLGNVTFTDTSIGNTNIDSYWNGKNYSYASGSSYLYGNSQNLFSVIAGNKFSSTVHMGCSLSSTSAGFMNIIFLDSTYTQLSATFQWFFYPSTEDVGLFNTSNDGTFTFLPQFARQAQQGLNWTATFNGNSNYRWAMSSTLYTTVTYIPQLASSSSSSTGTSDSSTASSFNGISSTLAREFSVSILFLSFIVFVLTLQHKLF